MTGSTGPESSVTDPRAVTLGDLPVFDPPGWRVVVVIMQKGGVGKTATTTGLVSNLAAQGVPCVGIDLCHTAALTQSFGLRRTEGEANLAELMLGKWDGSIYDLAVPVMENGWIVPMSTAAITLAEDLGNQRFREERLRAALEDLPARAVVVIDCPPTLDLRTDNAIIAAGDDGSTPQYGGLLLCPELVKASLETLDLLLQQVGAINTTTRYSARNLGWFASTTDQTRAAARARTVLEKLPELEKLGEMPRRTRIKDARDAGRPVLLFDPSSDVNTVHGELAKKIREKLSV